LEETTMLKPVPLARIEPLKIEAVGVPLNFVSGCQHLFEMAEVPTALPLISSYVSMGRGRALTGDCLAEIEIAFEPFDWVAETPSVTTHPLWFVDPGP
jgi:hypothetical protein